MPLHFQTPPEDIYADPKDRAKWKELIDSSGAENVIEVKMRRYDGSEIWVENHSRSVRGEDQAIRYVEGSLIDITERRQAEVALRESEERYKALTELLPIAIFETDGQGLVTFANHAAYQLTGYTEEDVDKGLNISKVIAAEDLAKAAKLYQIQPKWVPW